MTRTRIALYVYIGNNRPADFVSRRGPVAVAAAVDRVADRRHGLRIRSENDTTTYELGPLSYGPAGINKPHSLSVSIHVYIIYRH